MRLEDDWTILMDPELVHPNDSLPTPLFAIGEAVGGEACFDTVASLVACRDQIETPKNAVVAREPWRQQLLAAMTTDPWVWRTYRLAPDGEILTTYGHVLAADQIADLESDAGAGEMEIRRLLYRIREARRRGWLYAQWHSRVVPEGEMGCVHAADVDGILALQEAEAAKRAGWPERG